MKYVTREGKDQISGELDERIIVKRILKNVFVRVWTNFMKLGSRRKDYVKNGNESSTSMKDREFFDQPRETNSSTKLFYYGLLLD